MSNIDKTALTAPVATEQAQAVAAGWKVVPVEPTPEMVKAYLDANDAYWKRTDELPENPGKWRQGTPTDATAESYRAMLAASPEAAPAAMAGMGPTIQLNATQLRSALELAAPDFDTDEDQREVEVVLQRLPARTSSDGEPMEAGLYCWLAEYPEEGCIPLREDESFPAATPAAPSAAKELAAMLDRYIEHYDAKPSLTYIRLSRDEADRLRAALAQPAPVQVVAAGLTRDEIQKKALEYGFEYWRASDSHGVEGTKPQAIDLLQDLLGVEVEIKDNGCATCDGNGMIGGPSFSDPGEGGVPCPDCAPVQQDAPAPSMVGDAEEVMEMALCESQKLTLRIGHAYRFVPVAGCKSCEALAAEANEAYGYDHAAISQVGDAKGGA